MEKKKPSERTGAPGGRGAATPMPAFPDDREVEDIIAESEHALRERPAGISNSFGQYLFELQQYPVLKPENERKLAMAAQAGNEEAREALVRHNLRFVITVARKYASHGVSLEDLVQEGNIGLMKAVTKYRPEFGVKLISYAVYWIAQAIRATLADQQKAVRLPINRASQMARIRKVTAAFLEANGRKPSVREISEAADIPPHMVKTLMRVAMGDLSLDAPRGNDDEGGVLLSERIPNSGNLDREMERRCRSENIQRALECVRERDARILRLFYGLDGGREHTLEEIGQMLGVTRERIRQVRDRALKEIRNRYGSGLTDYIGEQYPEPGD